MRIAHQFMKVADRLSAGFEMWRLWYAGLSLCPVLYALIESTIIVIMAHCIAQHGVYAFNAKLPNHVLDVVFKVRMLRVISAGQFRTGECSSAFLERVDLLPPLFEFLSALKERFVFRRITS